MSMLKFKVRLGPVEDKKNSKKLQKDVIASRDPWKDHPSLSYLWATESPSLRPPPRQSHATIVPDQEAETNPTATYLRDLSQRMLVALCNDKNLSHPILRKHIAPFFSSRQDEFSPSKCRDDHLAVWAEALKEMPDYHAEIVDSVAEIHEGGRKARVWTFKRLSGIPATELEVGSEGGGNEDVGAWICKEGIGLMKWELRESLWMCVHLQMMRGVVAGI